MSSVSCRLLLCCIILISASTAMCSADIFDFKCSAPPAARLHGAKLLLVDDQVMIGEPSSPGHKGFVISSCSSNKGRTRIWFERENDKTRVLIVDDLKDVARVTFREVDSTITQLTNHNDMPETVQWTWTPEGKQIGEGVTGNLRVAIGKFKGWYLAAEMNAPEIRDEKSNRTIYVYPLKLVKDPAEAMKLTAYTISK